MTETSGPLAGVRVVELAGIGPGPFCGMLLADLGAEVIRVDRPGGPASPVPQRNDITSRGKRRVVVDLKHPRGAEVVLRLAAASDALIEGYRPGVAERLGVGPADCLASNPALVYGRMTGWGQDGPLASSGRATTSALHRGHRGAARDRPGPDGPPQRACRSTTSGTSAAGRCSWPFGLVAGRAVQARASGRGRVVDAAIVDGTALLQAMTYGKLADGIWTDQRGANPLDTGRPFYDVYPTADGRHMAVGALEPRFYAAFTGILFAPGATPGDLPAQHDRRRWPELRARFAARFAERTQEWNGPRHSAATDACVAPVRSLTEAPGDPHLAARGTYVTVDGVVQPAPAPRFGDGEPGAAVGALPAGRIAYAGAHTREVLTALGFADTEELLASGAAWQA